MAIVLRVVVRRVERFWQHVSNWRRAAVQGGAQHGPCCRRFDRPLLSPPLATLLNSLPLRSRGGLGPRSHRCAPAPCPSALLLPPVPHDDAPGARGRSVQRDAPECRARWCIQPQVRSCVMAASIHGYPVRPAVHASRKRSLWSHGIWRQTGLPAMRLKCGVAAPTV